MTSVERIASYADLPQEKGYRSTLDSHRQHLLRTPTGQGLLVPSQTKDSCPVKSQLPVKSSSQISRSPGETVQPTGHDSASTIKGGSSIVIKNLSVQYREDQTTPVIHNLSLQIQVHMPI